MDLVEYLFLCNYIPLPLSAVKIIRDKESHILNHLQDPKKDKIMVDLIDLNKNKNVSIKKIDDKAENFIKLVNNDIFTKIEQNIEIWKESGVGIITYFDKEYPERLRIIKNPPKTIFIKGNPDFSYNKAISIIGTRNPTKYGSSMAREIGKRFSERGFVIINGFAKGVDSESIKGSLETEGKIIGVLGSGILNLYPKENYPLFKKILKNDKGFFISEQFPESSVNKTSLATRNRISSALSLGNVFIEGFGTSGARWQLKYGKEQNKPIIVLEPKESLKETELTRDIIKNEKNALIIRDIKDIDNIIERILNE